MWRWADQSFPEIKRRAGQHHWCSTRCPPGVDCGSIVDCALVLKYYGISKAFTAWAVGNSRVCLGTFGMRSLSHPGAQAASPQRIAIPAPTVDVWLSVWLFLILFGISIHWAPLTSGICQERKNPDILITYHLWKGSCGHFLSWLMLEFC